MKANRTSSEYYILPGKFLLVENALGNPDLIQSSLSSDCQVTIVDVQNFPLDELEQWPVFDLRTTDIKLKGGSGAYNIYIIVPTAKNATKTFASIGYVTSKLNRDGYEILSDGTMGELLGEEHSKYYFAGTVGERGSDPDAMVTPAGDGRIINLDLGMVPPSMNLPGQLALYEKAFKLHFDDSANPEKLTSIEALATLWTNFALSSKGLNEGSGGSGEGGATALYQLNDIAKNASETGVLGAGPGKVLTYGTDGKWYAADAIGLDETALGEYLTDNNYAKKSDIPSLSGYATESWVLGKNYITSSALSDYATQSWVNSQGYATASSLKVVSDKLNDFLTGTDTDGIINKWKELEAFLAGQTQTSTLAELLAVKADKATTLSGYGITDAYTKSEINSKLSGYVTTTALNTALAKKVDVAFLGKVFGFIGEDNSEVAINDMEAVITSIKAKFGLWTDEYLSSKGLNPNSGGGSGEGATALYQLNDVAQNANGTGVLGAEVGKVLTYGSDGKWYAAKAGMDEDALSNYLTVNNYAKKSDIPSLDGYATITSVNSALDNKVDKVSGMGLSQNNFTDALLQKLNGIAEGANKYILPVAKAAVLGGVMIGSTLNASEAGVLNLPEVMTAGTYAKVTTDIYGRVTSGSSLSVGDIPALGISKITGLQDALDKKIDKTEFVTEFDKAMQRWFVRDTANKGLHPADYNSEAVGIYSDSYVSSKGVNTGTGGGTGGASSLGELNNVGSWADEIPTVDRIMVQRKGATHWESLNLSEIGLNESQLSNYLTTNNYAKKSDIPSLAGYATENWVLGKGYITSAALTGYATQSWVNTQLGSYATSSALQTVSDKLDDFLTGADTDDVINKWKELEDFLTGFKETDTLADALSLKADKTISISTGTGLSGGGNLTANRTISLKVATTEALGGIKVGSRLSIDANGVLSATYTYTLPTASATVLGGVKVGTTLAISSGVLNLKATGTAGTYFKVTTDAYGRVTSGSNPTTLSGFGITDGFNTVAYSGSGNAITSATFSGHTLTLVKGTTFLTKATFDDLFEKVNIGTTSAPVYAIKAKYGLYTDQFLSSKGMNTGTGGGSGSDYDRLDAWTDYDASKAGWVLSAGLGNDLNTRMTSLEGGAAVTVTPSGTGSVVTGVTKSGTVITVTKGNLAFGSLTGKPTTLAGYGITDAYTKTQADGAYVKKSGSAMTGGIDWTAAASGVWAIKLGTTHYIGYDGSTNSSMLHWTGTGTILGSLNGTTTIRSNTSNLSHNYNGTEYVILDARNYNSYAPTKTGTGASGTWGISITGNAATATKLGTATVGGGGRGIYLNAGVPTAMSATIGDSTVPVYMSSGAITATTWGLTGTTGNRVRKSGYVYSATASLSSYWGKLASTTFNGTTERDITLYVHSGAYGYYGIVAIRTRWESTTAFYVSCKIISGNLLADRFRLYYDASKTNGNVELWANVATQWGTLGAYVLSCTARTSLENGDVTLHTNSFSTAQTLPTTPYVSPTYITLYNNANTATQLQTARAINGTNFNGTNNITTSYWGTARSIGIVNSDGTGTAVVTSVNGSANVNLKLPATIKATITGNASSSTKLATARTITVGGQALAFDGTANITFTRNAMSVAYGKEASYSATTTADGWYRIAVSSKSIVNNNGIFTIIAAASGCHTVATINASISYGRNPSITQLGCSHYSNIQIRAVRLVWHDSYTDNYAYLEIQTAAAIATTIGVKIVGGNGWNIYTSATAGSIPSGYSSKSLTLVGDSIRATTFVGALNGNAGSATKLQTARTIFGKSFDGSANVAGQAFVYGNYTDTASSRYHNGGIQVRENGLVGSAQTDDGYAPTIGFHWQSKIAASLIMSSAGNFKFLKQNFTDYAPIYAGQITAQESYLRSVNNGNTVQIGSQNTTYAHFTSSKPFWFNTGMEINGYCYPYTNNSFTLGNASKRWSGIYGTVGDFSSYIQIGSIRLTYDSANNAIKVSKSDGTAAGLYAMGFLSSMGLATGTGGGGGGSDYDRLDSWSDYTADKAGYVLSAKLGNDLNTRLTSVAANYVTTNTAQTITAQKTWTTSQRMGKTSIHRVNDASGANATGGHWYTNNYAAVQFGIGVYTEANANPRAYIGWTATPWQVSTNLTVSSTQLTYKANNILHAANYNNYAPSKTGTGASGTWSINVTGNAGSATRLMLNGGTAKTWTTLADTTGNAIVGYTDTSTSGRWFDYGSVFQFSNQNNPDPGVNSHWVTQLLSATTNSLGVRWRTNTGAWSAVQTLLTSYNYTNYAPTKTGSGASGTWGISITGNAATVGGFAASKFMQNFASSSTDLNDMVTSGVYRTTNTNANLPSGTYYYSQVLVLRGGGDTIGQLAMSYSQSGRMAVRSGNPTQVGGTGTWGAWNTVAFTTDNVASATKLQTARTLWGQSFNGTANVSGNLTSVGHIQFSANASYNIGTTGNNASAVYARTLQSNSTLYLASTAASILFKVGDTEAARILGSNYFLGLGVTAPTQKLDVAGNVKATGYFYSGGWFENNAANKGLYNSVGDARWYWNGTGWYADKAIFSVGTINGTVLKSTVPSGTAPLVVASSTKVTNLNADLLEGYHGSTTQAASTVVIRNSSGYIYANYINSNTPVNENASINQIITTTSSDGFYRKSSIGQLRNALTNTRTTLDLTALDANKWYPCSMVVSSRYLTEIRIWNTLEGDKPAWATHTNGFTLNLVWQVTGSGWGGTNLQRKILNSYYAFAPSNPCGGIEQNYMASVEIVYLRGGAKYYYAADNGGTFTINSSGYSWASGDSKYTAAVLTSPKKNPALCYESTSMLGVVDLYVGNILSAVNFSNRLNINGEGKIYPYSTSTRRAGMYGVYDAAKIGHIWSMGTAYQIADDGSNFGSLYGFAYKHTNNATGGTMAGGHQAVWCENGTPRVAMGTNFWVANAATIGTVMSASTVTIRSTNAVGHLNFSRGNFNYITANTGGSVVFVVNGQGVEEATSDLIISDSQVRPGTNNATSLGLAAKRWSNTYTQLLNVAGAATLSSTLTVSGVLTASSTLNVTGIFNANNTTDATSTTAAGAVFDGGVGIVKQLKVGGATTLGSTLSVTSTITGSGSINALRLGISNTSITTGNGLSLYAGAVTGMPTYGIAFAGTATFGTHGGVTSDWATYLTMNDATTRGWIFRRGTTNVASISGAGTATLGGGLSVASTSTFTGKTTHNGGLGATTGTFSSTLSVTGVATFSNATDATSTTAAGVKVTGGLGVAKQLRVGSTSTFTGKTTHNGGISTTTMTMSSTGDNVLLFTGAAERRIHFLGDREDHWARIQGLYTPVPNVGHNIQLNIQVGIGAIQLSSTNGTLFVVGQNEILARGVLHNTTGMYSDGYMSSRGLNDDSDMRLKNKVRDIFLSVKDIANAPAFEYTWKDGTPGVMAGSSAQYWQKVLSCSVREKKDGYLSMFYGHTAMVGLISLARHHESLEQRVARLEKENKEKDKTIEDLNQKYITLKNMYYGKIDSAC